VKKKRMTTEAQRRRGTEIKTETEEEADYRRGAEALR
jgi:hypothetical protein